ncbi:MAG: cell division protein FtsQ, partial [Sphingobium sp.]|nr:cell division protein FtsQ [Sphingobium sp.]
ATPALRPLVKAASWIGDRRWNLLFATGETLVLPEDNAQAALLKFAELDSNRRLLGQGLLRFDMRDPTRLVVRPLGAGGARTITDTSAASIIDRASRSEA